MSGVYLIVFLITVFFSGWIWAMIERARVVVIDTTLTNDATFQLLVWFGATGVLALILLVSALWFLTRLQKPQV